jgi:hypothetical protein
MGQTFQLTFLPTLTAYHLGENHLFLSQNAFLPYDQGAVGLSITDFASGFKP